MNVAIKTPTGRSQTIYISAIEFKNERRAIATFTVPKSNGSTINNKLSMFMTNDNIYFGIDNERWIITGFQHIPLKRLISALNRGAFEGQKLVTEMDIFTTIMSEPNKIGILVKHPESVFGLSNKHRDKNLREILCTPTQGKYQKSSWGYKIAIAPKSLEFKNKWPPAEYYFLDFCEQLYTGQFGLIALT